MHDVEKAKKADSAKVKNLPIIQSLWIGGELSNVERLAICSFLHHGHAFHLYTYGEVKNIPKGTVIKDGKTILPEAEIFTHKATGSYAIFADWFRWALLYKQGNFWVDMDMVCLRPLDFDIWPVFGFGREDKKFILNSILAFPARDKICKFMAKACENPLAILAENSFRIKIKKCLLRLIYTQKEYRPLVSWGASGGVAPFTNAATYWNIKHLAKSEKYFNPMSDLVWEQIFTKDIPFESISNSYLIHLSNEMIRRSGMDKNAKYPEYCIFEQLKKRYLF